MVDKLSTVIKLALDEKLISVGIEELRANRSNLWETCGRRESNNRCRNESSKCKDFWIHCSSIERKIGSYAMLGWTAYTSSARSETGTILGMWRWRSFGGPKEETTTQELNTVKTRGSTSPVNERREGGSVKNKRPRPNSHNCKSSCACWRAEMKEIRGRLGSFAGKISSKDHAFCCSIISTLVSADKPLQRYHTYGRTLLRYVFVQSIIRGSVSLESLLHSLMLNTLCVQG